MATIDYRGLTVSNTLRLQHQRLHSLMDAIAARFQNERKPSRNLVSLLNALAAHLQTLFELEEIDGYLAHLAQQSPVQSAVIERLLAEHAALLADVNNLVTRGREDFAINQDTDDLAHRFADFRARLDAHEHEEIKVAQQAYNIDLGTKD